jgi:hypothetical protein
MVDIINKKKELFVVTLKGGIFKYSGTSSSTMLPSLETLKLETISLK